MQSTLPLNQQGLSHYRNAIFGIFVGLEKQNPFLAEANTVNLVDMLKEQMMGEVGKKLGGMIGAKEADMGKILSAGLPSVLSGLGSIATTKTGADKLAKSINGMDSSVFGDLGKMLGSNAMSSGGGMLGGLLGGNVVDGIANVIAKFTGINVAIVKSALGYLAPIVLASVGASFKGAKPDGTGIAKLFSEQKGNISAAMPKGLSLDSVPGFQSLASNVAGTANQAASEVGSGIGKLIVPVAVIAAIVAAGFFLFNNGKKELDAVKEKTVDANRTAMDAKLGPASSVNSAVDASADVVKTSINGMMDGLMTNLNAIQDSAGADAAMPALKEMASKVDGIGLSISALPEGQRTMIGSIIKAQLVKLNPILEKISALPGVGDSFKALLNQIKEKLSSFIS